MRTISSVKRQLSPWVVPSPAEKTQIIRQPRKFLCAPAHAMGVAEDRRRGPRSCLGLPLRLASIGGCVETLPVTLITKNISSTGVYALAPRVIAPGTAIELEVALMEQLLGPGSTVFRTRAHVVRTGVCEVAGWSGFAASFDDIDFQRDERVPLASQPQMTRNLLAVECIRRMRGDSQSQLMRCSDGNYYVVKFQNNPQGLRVLANEVLGSLLATSLDLPVPKIATIEVTEDIIRYSDDMVIQSGRGREPLQAGLCFGSFFLRSCREFVANGVPWGTVENSSDFFGMLVFDKWTCNTDARQVVFAADSSTHRATMIDQGNCFNAGEWTFPDAPLRGLCHHRSVYRTITGMRDFDPWLETLEQRIDAATLFRIGTLIPPEWYGSDREALGRLLCTLDRRRPFVRELLQSTLRTCGDCFPNAAFDGAKSHGRDTQKAT